MGSTDVDKSANQISFSTLLPLKQLLEVRHSDEDWTGITSSAKRRKLQNRLHQRAWRRHQARQSTDLVPEGPCKRKLAHSRNPAKSERGPLKKIASICAMSPSSATELLTRFEHSAYQQYLLGSPRVDLLLTLVKFNVFRALVDNSSALGFGLDWLNYDAVSPFAKGATFVDLTGEELATSTCPGSLKPTSLQRSTKHHPWIDLFPFPSLRDNILLAGESLDEDALCRDMVEVCGKPGERSGLIVWGDPWVVGSWEVSEHFLKHWPWLIEDCVDLFKATNYWRLRRGEARLFPNAVPTSAGYR